MTLNEKTQGIDLETPWAAFVMVGILALVFFRELACSAVGSTEPVLSTLIAMGASSRELTIGQSEWYRILTATFLHGSLSHLFFNCLALALGYSLERVIGAAWFLAIYLLSGIGGGIFSVALNPADQVGVGASGAILGIFAAQLVIAYMRYPEGETRKYLADRSWRVLIPTLASFTGADGSIDFAAHLGGAITGAAVAVTVTLIWNQSETYPHDRTIAWAIVGTCAAVVVVVGVGQLRAGCGYH